MKKTPDKTSKVNIIEVYEDNFISEIKRISEYLEEFNYIGMDTEFPGIVYGVNYTQDFYYKALKINVDSLKLIQLGITLCNEKGEYPKEISTWQFNLKFDYKKDQIASNSFTMLCNCGIDFEKLKTKGIDHKLFAEYLTISGLVLNPEVHWISFHGSYDFGYMLRLLLNKELPETENEFTNELIEYFPNHYDIRILVQGKDNLKGGLNRLAQYLEVLRVGKTHQAGSDSVVTADVFFKLLQNNFIDNESVEMDKNILFGLGDGANDEETIQYTKFNITPNLNGVNVNGGPTIPNGQNYNYMGINSTTGGNMITPGNKNNLSLNLMYPPYANQQYGYGYGMKVPIPGQINGTTNSNLISNNNGSLSKKGTGPNLLVGFTN